MPPNVSLLVNVPHAPVYSCHHVLLPPSDNSVQSLLTILELTRTLFISNISVEIHIQSTRLLREVSHAKTMTNSENLDRSLVDQTNHICLHRVL